MSYFQKVLIIYLFIFGALVFCSDLALRNCLLTSDIKVKIGDYGLAHNKYKVCTLKSINFYLLKYIYKMSNYEWYYKPEFYITFIY